MNSLRRKSTYYTFVFYPVFSKYVTYFKKSHWNTLKNHFEILWEITDDQARYNSLNTRGVWSYIVRPSFCDVSCFLLNDQQKKGGTLHSENKELPLGMPAPLVQILAAWKLAPVERNINFEEKTYTQTRWSTHFAFTCNYWQLLKHDDEATIKWQQAQ